MVVISILLWGFVYLPMVQKFIEDNGDRIVAIIFCGGFTQAKTANGYSEAYVMSSFITQDTDERLPDIYLEEDSYTTYYNSKNAVLIIEEILDARQLVASGSNEDIRIVIACEATMSANVMMLARHLMSHLVKEPLDNITVETASWERADPFKQVVNLVYNKLAITFPWLGLAEREERKRIYKAKHQ